MLSGCVIRQEFVNSTKFKMDAEDAIVSGVRRTLQKGQVNFPSHYNVHSGSGAYSAAIQWLRGGGGGLFSRGQGGGEGN